MAKTLTPRGRALRWLTTHRGITEDPPGSNCDKRKDGIRAAQDLCAGGGTWLRGLPWCGVWFYAAAHAGGVRPREPSRWASVSAIEDDARSRSNGFRGWTTPANPNWHKRVLRGDGVVLFGRGKHVESVRSLAPRKLGYIVTDGGNTSAGKAGSQDNGGGAFRRLRKISDVHGFALVDYPDA